ncbi:MAG TPA: sulfatase-like hydrolase/transferase, partial [Microthrixaceae bacterium]|nr:sulfatase-like hydrolase/transferase [Microthrixaceae bacterium]
AAPTAYFDVEQFGLWKIVTSAMEPIYRRYPRAMDSNDRPNVLLITLDQFRADCLGIAGHSIVSTPNLDALAERGVRFANHYSNCAPCAPARASLLTGLWQSNHRVTNNGAPLSDDLPMLPRLMRDEGYDSVLFGFTDTALDPATLDPDDPRRLSWELPMSGFRAEELLDDNVEGWIKWLAELGYEVPKGGGPANRQIYEPADVPVPADRGESWRPARYSAEHSEAAYLTGKVLAWLGQPERREEPFFAHISYIRPHPPYLAPEPYNSMFDPADVPAPVRAATIEEEASVHPFLKTALMLVPSPINDLDQRQLTATYYGMIAEVDAQLGRLLDGLEELDLTKDTVILLTSDHGEQMGDHWLIEKLGYFDQSYRIPLIISAPAFIDNPGRVVEAFTENVDITPTLLDMVGAPAPAMSDGSSLKQLLAEPEAEDDWWRSAVHFEFDFREPTSDFIEQLVGLRQDQCTISVIRDHKGKYVHFAGDFPALFYDLEKDPDELVNRADDPAYTATILDYAQRLLSMQIEHTDPRLGNTRATPLGTIHRSDPPRQLRAGV